MIITTQWIYQGEPYRPASHLFNSEHLQNIDTYLQQRYQPFAERLNREQAFLQVDLSFTAVPKQVHFEANLLGASPQLEKDIADHLYALDHPQPNQ